MTRMQRGAALLQWRRQRQEMARRRPTLILIALLDVFTFLVFFFLVHSSDGAPDEQSGCFGRRSGGSGEEYLLHGATLIEALNLKNGISGEATTS